ncbi:hypothetical protein RRG08_049399 [Elysia crispata]|uniref:Uncharacterized protein n=1 Tax=Elysia crispata TaxID=231223 RepID=A0AAE0XE63_9GAST|nr:hypothetical protein RRG08_049399 [Elysia crispata]
MKLESTAFTWPVLAGRIFSSSSSRELWSRCTGQVARLLVSVAVKTRPGQHHSDHHNDETSRVIFRLSWSAQTGLQGREVVLQSRFPHFTIQKIATFYR